MKPKSSKITTKQVQDAENNPFTPPTVDIHAEPDDAPWGDDGLTFKQREFVKAYVGPAAGNATKAAEMAGYNAENRNSLAVTAFDNLRKPNIQRAVARAMADREGGPEWTRAGIVEIARSNIADYLKVDENGKGTIDLKRANEAAAMGTIKKLRVRDMGAAGQEVTVETYDRLAALSLLAKMHGIIVDQTNVNITTPQQQALGRILKDPKAFALARQLSERMSETNADAGDN